ncbi:phage tail protein [Pelagicoccus sp. SDUM812003]|uniref:phage tail protein n=1 Tax=Pelagicoccus sp. SDUM812003 TaxID=3041267 RepID=UPI00280DDD01|nr:phage tail protein [Pelagicoccus sp. SDUM812003]MDQ8202390.1 phage tail protein [Pelagicoccus sp. SDUM812003]
MKAIINTLLLFALASFAHAQPDYVNYQGLLKDAEGQPLSTGSYQMEFNIYDEATGGGMLIWGPFYYDDGSGDGHAKQVPVANGRFNVILGPKDTAGRYLSDSFSGDMAFVEISVAGGDPILPRQQILSTPYALESANAKTLGGLQPVEYRNPAGMIAPFAGSSDKVPDGWLLCDGSELVASAYPELYDIIGKSWGGRQESAGETTIDYFNLPDLRGMFLRGANLDRSDEFADEGPRSVSSSDAGTTQVDSLKLHRHAWGLGSNGSDLQTWHINESPYTILDFKGDRQIENGNDDFEDNYLDVRLNSGDRVYTAPDSTIDASDSFTPGETRPRNAAVNYIIKL